MSRYSEVFNESNNSVFLFILSQRIAGCLVAEPIEKAFKVLSISTEESTDATDTKEETARPTTLQFGDFEKSFCLGFVLGRSQLAFSQPTLAGKALGSNYIGVGSFLVYKFNNLSSTHS
ncbi:protein CHROMOSOME TRANSMISSION FIDELITY 7-like [Morus notabilis]|uniref:protein CHROMOSOME TRANSMISSION FIDELITY 7-like n=1 Tax=Morus notabilis TaxID=981085 RepID=UPI000CED18C9|nr:protein CHROMOSOME TRANSMISSION FIDELITY 7-like [Morus notabilis]